MKLQHLHTICAIVDEDLSISSAARILYRSQPSVTRHVQDLEEELQIKIFFRSKNRIVGITPEGQKVVAIARRMVRDAREIDLLSRELGGNDDGDFNIAATHTQARYMLPSAIQSFIAHYPRIELRLHQGDPPSCYGMVERGAADVAICSRWNGPSAQTVFLPCYRLERCLVVPQGHPLASIPDPTLEDIARFPIILYSSSYSSHQTVMTAFESSGVTPKIVMHSIDADVSKSYVRLGLGVAILASIAFDPDADVGLSAVDVRRLFPSTMLGTVILRNTYLRRPLLTFLRLFAPHLTRAQIESMMMGGPELSDVPVGHRQHSNLI